MLAKITVLELVPLQKIISPSKERDQRASLLLSSSLRASQRSILVDSRAPTVFNAIISLAPLHSSAQRSLNALARSLPSSFLLPHFSYFRLCGDKKEYNATAAADRQRIRPGSIVVMLLPHRVVELRSSEANNHKSLLNPKYYHQRVALINLILVVDRAAISQYYNTTILLYLYVHASVDCKCRATTKR